MINFLQATIDFLESYDKTIDDIVWIGDDEHFTTWEDFASKADFKYKNGVYPCPYDNWLIVGDNWWLERCYDPISEWWEYREKPQRPKSMKLLDSVVTKDVSGTKWRSTK